MELYRERNRSRTREAFRWKCPKTTISEEAYAYERGRNYGPSHDTNWPATTEEGKHYRRYKEYQSQTDSARLAYDAENQRADREYGEFVDGDGPKRRYYRDTSGGLLPRQHGELAAGASDWEVGGLSVCPPFPNLAILAF